MRKRLAAAAVAERLPKAMKRRKAAGDASDGASADGTAASAAVAASTARASEAEVETEAAACGGGFGLSWPIRTRLARGPR